MRLFDRKPESPAEVRAEKKLDEVTYEAADAEMDKEAEREHAGFAFGPFKFRRSRGVPFHRVPGDPVAEPVDDSDPADSRSLSDVLHEHDDSA